MGLIEKINKNNSFSATSSFAKNLNTIFKHACKLLHTDVVSGSKYNFIQFFYFEAEVL